MDVTSLNENIDLLALAGELTTLKRVSRSGGGEWAGACPFCGGRDRFHVQPEQSRWLCRHCTDGKWQDPIAFGKRQSPNLPFRELCQQLARRFGGNLHEDVVQTTALRPVPPRPVYRAAVPPDDEWQARAFQIINAAKTALWSSAGERARAYLHSRGLEDETILHFHLGYETHKIVIPCVIEASGRRVIWYVKYRHAPGGKLRYSCLTGSQTAAIFHYDDLLVPEPHACLLTEGEFDCMIAHQVIGDVVPVATLGSVSTAPDVLTFGMAFVGKRALAVYDNDEAGKRAANLTRLTGRYERITLPAEVNGKPVKDVNAFALAGGDLYHWIEPHLQKAEEEPI